MADVIQVECGQIEPRGVEGRKGLEGGWYLNRNPIAAASRWRQQSEDEGGREEVGAGGLVDEVRLGGV
jgi:hypothetical protein